MSLEPAPTSPNGEHATPLWRRHFPVSSEAETSRSRREFLGGAAVAGGAMTCGQLAFNEISSSPVSIDGAIQEYGPLTLEKNFDELAIGESLLFHYPNERSPCILLRLSATELVAFQQKCTHLACPVSPEYEKNEFHCPCHHGSFELRTGEPISGPPRSPLRKVNIAKSADGTLTAVAFHV